MDLEPHHVDAVVSALHRSNELLAIIAEAAAPPYYRPPASQAYENGSGFATIVYQHFPGGAEKLWLVEKIFVWSDSEDTPQVGVFVMEGLPPGATQDRPNALATAIDPLYQRDSTSLLIAAGDELSRIVVKGAENLIFQWQGISTGARCVASIQYRLAWQGQG